MSYRKEVEYLNNHNLEISVLSYNIDVRNGSEPEYPGMTYIYDTKEEKFLIGINNNNYEIIVGEYKLTEHYQAKEEDWVDTKDVKKHRLTITIENNRTKEKETYEENLLNNNESIPKVIKDFINNIKEKALLNNIGLTYLSHINRENDNGDIYPNRGMSYHRLLDEYDNWENEPETEVDRYYEEQLNKSKKLKIVDEEEKEYYQYKEVKEELFKYKSMVEGLNESEVIENFQRITNNGDVESEDYYFYENRVFAFIEIDRLEKELLVIEETIECNIDLELKNLKSINDIIADYNFSKEIEDNENFEDSKNEEKECRDNIEKINKELEDNKSNILSFKKQMEEIHSDDMHFEDIHGKYLHLLEEKDKLEIELDLLLSEENMLSISNKHFEYFKNFDYKKEIDNMVVTITRLERYNYNMALLKENIIPNIFLIDNADKKLNINKIIEVNNILLTIEKPKEVLEKLNKLSDESQIETIYAFSKSSDLIKGFLNTKFQEREENQKDKLKSRKYK